MFTQKELEDAYTQMRAERCKEAETAAIAAEWVRKELALGVVRCHNPEENTGCSGRVCDPKKYVIVCVNETYGPHLEDYTNKLDNVAWAKSNNEWVYGYVPNTPFYDIETPFGKFKLTFEYFDNHVGGF